MVKVIYAPKFSAHICTRMLPESSYLGNSPVALYGQYDVFHIIIRPTMPLMPGRPTQLRSKLWTATFRAGRCWSMLVVKFFPWFPRFLQFRMDVVHSDRNCSALFLVTYSWTLLRSVFSRGFPKIECQNVTML